MLEIFSMVEVGKRSKNDDRTLVNDVILDSGEKLYTKSNTGIIAVFDGVGGNPEGGTAASMCAKEFSKLQFKELDEGIIGKTVFQAEANLIGRMITVPGCFGMSTTSVGMWFNEKNALIFNVGDSCVYRYRSPFVSKLTTEHTVATMNRLIGIPVKQNDENILTRSIGSGQSEPDITETNIFKDDLFIVCSDGISKHLSDEEMECIIEENDELETIGEKLIDSAINNGSTDNLSVIIARSI